MYFSNKQTSLLGLALTLTLALTLAVPGSARADTLRVQGGLWAGELSPELEQRFFLDDLISGSSFGRYNLTWGGKDETFAWHPIGIEYHKPLGDGALILGANWNHYDPDFTYAGIRTNPSLSLVTLMDYERSDTNLNAGYRIGVLDGTLLLTPGVGMRFYDESFRYSELTIGTTNQISLESPWQSSARGIYLGMEVRYKALPSLDLIADYRSSAITPALTGRMHHERTIVGVSGSALVGSYERIEADVEMEMLQWSLGIEFHLTERLHIFGGIREETLTIKYPGYFSLPIVVDASGTASLASNIVTEFISDAFIYSQPMRTRKGLIYFGVAYDFAI